MMCLISFIDYNKENITVVRDVNNGEIVHAWGRVYMETVLPTQFCCVHKPSLKKLSIKNFKRQWRPDYNVLYST